MGLIKRKIVSDEEALSPLAFLMWPVFGISGVIGVWWYETLVLDNPILTPENSPTLAGIGIQYLWVIVALIVAISIILWVLFMRKSVKMPT